MTLKTSILICVTSGCAGPASANIVQDIAKGFVRPDLASEEATVVMMDARGTLYELKVSRISFLPQFQGDAIN